MARRRRGDEGSEREFAFWDEAPYGWGMESPPHPGARRELSSRQQPWAGKLARRMAATGLTPNAISLLSLVFSAAAAGALLGAGRPGTAVGVSTICYLGAAVGIQLRLLCNLLDGMVAIECGKKSATGGIYNEAPDRLADVILLVAAGQWAGPLWGTTLPLGWLAAVLAVGMAYIRVLGGTLTGTQNFMGPMAKQHRMFLLTVACLAAAAISWLKLDAPFPLWSAVLHLMVLASALTCVLRLREIARLLRNSERDNS